MRDGLAAFIPAGSWNFRLEDAAAFGAAWWISNRRRCQLVGCAVGRRARSVTQVLRLSSAAG